MAGRKDQQTRPRTRIAQLRLEHNLTQAAVAYAIGIPLSSYRKLERGRQRSPNLRVLVNLSLLYDVPLESILHPWWLAWEGELSSEKYWQPKRIPLDELRSQFNPRYR